MMTARWSNGTDSIEATGDSAFVTWAHREFHAFRAELAEQAQKQALRDSMMAERNALFSAQVKAKNRIKEIDLILRHSA